jgi:hypothetical protein
MRGFVGLYDAAEVVVPVESGLVSLESSQQTIYHVGSSSDGLGKFVPDEISGIVDRQFFAVLVLHESEVLLDVVSEPEDIAMLATDGHEFLPIKVPDFVFVVFHS